MAVFGLKYYAEMRSKYQGITWRCDIAQRGYTGPSEEMTFSGVSPIKITWERRGEDFYTPVKASEASINILCTHNFHYLSLFTSDPRVYRMSLYRNGSLCQVRLQLQLKECLRIAEKDTGRQSRRVQSAYLHPT